MKRATWLLHLVVPTRICEVECPMDQLIDYGIGIVARAGRWAVASYPTQLAL